MRLDEKIGEMSYDGLICDDKYPIDVMSVLVRAGQGTLKRGTALALSTGAGGDGAMVILGTATTGDVATAAAEYALTLDVAFASGKTYYTRSGNAGAYVYTPVAAPEVANIATYYQMTKAAVVGYATEVLTANCILCDDVVTGTGSAVVAVAYRSGHFVRNKLIVKAGYTFAAADEAALRSGGIYLDNAML